ncbi:MAG: alpha/beta hydrolase [Myxococcota bacterium]
MMSETAGIRYRHQDGGDHKVVFIHGWMVSGRVFDGFLEPESEPSVARLIPDLRGAGDSHAHQGAISIADLASDVVAVLDDAEIERAALVGHSMGGKVAQWLAIHHPDRVSSLFLLCPVPASAMDLPENVATLFRESGGDRDAQREILNMACVALPPARRDGLLDDAGRISKRVIQDGFDAWAREEFSDELGRIQAPTTVVASDDPFLPRDFLSQALVRAVDGARLVHVPNAGHYVHLEAPEAVRVHYNQWLSTLP